MEKLKDYKLKCEIFVKFREDDTGELSAEMSALFDCDPRLNTECKKTGCGECTRTSKIQCAKKYGLFE